MSICVTHGPKPFTSTPPSDASGPASAGEPPPPPEPLELELDPPPAPLELELDEEELLLELELDPELLVLLELAMLEELDPAGRAPPLPTGAPPAPLVSSACAQPTAADKAAIHSAPVRR